MRVVRLVVLGVMGAFSAGGGVWGQGLPAPGRGGVVGGGPGVVSSPGAGRGPRNMEQALPGVMRVDAEGESLEKFMESLREMTQTNIVVNWNALARTGITKETPVTVHWKEISYEHVLQTLMEILPATGSKVNYVVGENTLEITTNADLGVALAGAIYPVTLATTYTLGNGITAAEQEANARIIEKVLKAELVRAGEPMEAKGHELGIKGGTLAATVSERGQTIIKRAMNMFNAPLKVGSLASGTQLTPSAKKTQDAYKAFVAGASKATLEEMAREPAKYGQFNIGLLPGAKEAAATAPEGVSVLGMAVNDGGVLLIGTREALRRRTVLAVYDLRDLIKRLNFKNTVKPQPTVAEYESAIVQVVQTIKPDGDGKWGTAEDLGKEPVVTSVMVPYGGLLVVFATGETQRTVAGALQDMNK